MARLFIDGGESGSGDLWDAGQQPSASASTPYDGTYKLSIVTSASKSGFSNSELYFAFRYYRYAATAASVIGFYGSSTLLGRLYREGTSNYLQAQRGTLTTLATGTHSIGDAWTLIEVWYKPHDSTGRFVVKVGGITDIDYTGDTTEGGTTIDQIQLSIGHYDNFIVDSAAWIGDTRIQAIVPSGAGTTTEWDPSAGSNYECVDERPYSDTDYVSTNVNDETDTYAFGNLTGSISSIKCVQVQARAAKEGASTPTNIALVARPASTDYASGDKALSTSYGSLFNIWETDPETTSAWIESGVNASEFGVKSRA